MRRVLLLVPFLALAGCKNEEPPPGAVKVTVSYSGFVPGCVLVVAQNADGSEERSTAPLAGKAGGPLVVAVLPPESWGSSVKVEARAYEKRCEGDAVVTRSESVELVAAEVTPVTLPLAATDADGDGYVSRTTGGTDCQDNAATVNPGVQEERCNNTDDNCNGVPDVDELRLGQACTEGASCEGTRQCAADGTVFCDSPASLTAYVDVDRDRHGDRNAAAMRFCGSVPAGYATGPNDDCNDSAPTVYTGASELCDNLDNNCNGTPDEGVSQAGSPCTTDQQCNGVYTCSAGVFSCQATQSIQDWYLDGDGDGYGTGTAVRSCQAPSARHATQAGDCNDGNPLTHPNAAELCDAEDNDCDPQVDEGGVCASSPAWTARTVGAADLAWNSVSALPDMGVVVVGRGNQRGLLLPAVTGNTFTVTNTGCDDSQWYSLWRDAENSGRSYFGSAGGRLAYQDLTPSCVSPQVLGLPAFGLMGVRNGANLEIHGVGVDEGPFPDEGFTFVWDGGSGLTMGPRIAPVYDIHGRSRQLLLAVGGYEATLTSFASPRIYRLDAGTGQWQSMNVENSVSGAGRLDGVWVVDENVAFAVGDSGSVLRWDGSRWNKLSFPNFDNLTSVIAFGASSAFVTSTSGRVYRYNGSTWTRVYPGNSRPEPALVDIGGTSPADLWAVGGNGTIVRWPQWP